MTRTSLDLPTRLVIACVWSAFLGLLVFSSWITAGELGWSDLLPVVLGAGVAASPIAAALLRFARMHSNGSGGTLGTAGAGAAICLYAFLPPELKFLLFAAAFSFALGAPLEYFLFARSLRAHDRSSQAGD